MFEKASKSQLNTRYQFFYLIGKGSIDSEVETVWHNLT